MSQDHTSLFGDAAPVKQDPTASARRPPLVLSIRAKFVIAIVAVAIFAGSVGVIVGRRGHESETLAQIAAAPAPSAPTPSSVSPVPASPTVAPIAPVPTTTVQARATNSSVQPTNPQSSITVDSIAIAQDHVEPAVAPAPLSPEPTRAIVQTVPKIESTPVTAVHQMLSSAGTVSPSPVKTPAAAVTPKAIKHVPPLAASVPTLAARPVPALPSSCALTGTVHGEHGEALPGIDGFVIVRFTIKGAGIAHDVAAPIHADGAFSAPEIPAAGQLSIMVRAKKFRDLIVQLDRQNCGAAPAIALVKSNPFTSLRDAVNRANQFNDQAHSPQPATH